MKIAFFLSDYPVLTETFVINEIFWLQEEKIGGKIWYEVSGKENKQPLVNKIKYQTEKIIPSIKKNLREIIKAHFYWFFKNPVEYIYSIYLLPLKINWIDIRSIIKAPLIAKSVDGFDPDLIYNHDADNAFYHSMLVSKLIKKPLIVIFHTYHLFHKSEHLLEKIKQSNVCIFQSNYSKNYAIKKAPKYKQRFKVVSSTGIDINFFKNKKIKPKEIKSKTIKIITVGRLEKSKGFNFLIKAISILKKQKFKIECKIIGSGSQENKLKKLTKLMGLKDEIKFLGTIPHNQNLITSLSNSEIFVLPSLIRDEGDRDMQPNAIKEAMSMELLTITSNLGGIEEVIHNNKNGFLLKNNKPEHIADKIKSAYLLSEKEKSAIKKEARKTIEKKYESKKINQQLLDLFLQYEK